MTLPSDLQRILDIAEHRAKITLRDLGDSPGAAEAQQVAADFGKRTADLVRLYAQGKMTAEAAQRAFESEREALALNLAAIIHENKRAWLQRLFSDALGLVAGMLGAGLRR
jgi:hypothetical protein